MARSLSTFSSKRFPLACVLAVGILVGIHLYVSGSETFWDLTYRYSRIPKEDPLRLEAQLRLMPGPTSAQRKVLLVGSSLTREGFDVEYLNRRFGSENVVFYNLGVAGSSQPIDIYMLRKRLIEKAPAMIVYMPFVESFYSGYNDNDYNRMHHHFDSSVVPYLVDHFGWRYLLAHQRSLTDAAIGKVSILYRFRKQFNRVAARWIRARLRGEEDPKPMNYEYSIDQPAEYFVEKLLEYQGSYRYSKTEYTSLNQELFHEFVSEISNAGIELMVIDGPVHPRMKALYSEETEEDYKAFLRDSASEFGFDYVRRDQLPGFRTDDFIDFAHLNAYGRGKLSEFMASCMAGVESGSVGKLSTKRDKRLGLVRAGEGDGERRKTPSVVN